MKGFSCLLFLTMIFMVSGCNPGAGGDDPNAALEKFLNALAIKDIEEAKKYVTKESVSFMNVMKMGINMAGENQHQIFKKENIIIGDAVIKGDRATVNVKDKSSDQASNFILKKETGAWKVAFDKVSFMEMIGEKMEDGDLQKMQEGFSSETMKKATDALKNMSDSDIQKAGKAMDSLSKMFEEMNKNGKMDEAMKEATKMLEQMQKKEL